MCYPCTQCGRCGKYEKTSPYYTPPANVPCFACGGEVDTSTGACTTCGAVAFAPGGKKRSDTESAPAENA